MPKKKGKDAAKKGTSKKKKGSGDGTNAAVCRKFLKHYQQKCEANVALPYRSFVQDINKCIEEDKLIEKFILERREERLSGVTKTARPKSTAEPSTERKDSCEGKGVVDPVPPEVEPKLTLQPLLDSMRDTRYRSMTQLSLVGLPLVNADAATLAIFLGTEYIQVLKTLEIVRAEITEWAFPQVMKPLVNCKLLTTLTLDHNPITPGGLLSLSESLKDHTTLTTLNLNFCQLTSECGGILGGLAAVSSLQNLSLVGNSLRCGGVSKLLGTVVEACEKSARIPSLAKLFLMDNGIDAHGEGGLAGPVNCGRIVKKLLLVDPLLLELNLDTNLIGETASLEILDGLKQRKEAGHPQVRITVTHRITHETFKAIIELSLSFGKKKGKKGGKKKKKS